ncbi:MAG TPA: GIY-YIG nuclease family protein [Bryobacteraceae bacterium]|jgi:hypothetical protein
MIDKRELKREAKTKVSSKGIFAVRCTPSGESWVSSSRDLKSSQTGIWFMLRNGMHHNRMMQAAWNVHGAGAFHFEILETLDDDLPPLLLKDSLRDRQKHWQTQLDATAV